MRSARDDKTRSNVVRLLLVPLLAVSAAGPAGAGDAAKWGARAERVSIAPPAARALTDQLARGVFLIASRQLTDPNFAETVVLLLEYDDSGALGLIINRPTKIALAKLLPEVKELEKRPDVVYVGGPVARERIVLLMRTSRPPDSSGRIFADTYVSSSLATLKQMLSDARSDESFHAYAGYAGWAPGQLDGEVHRGDWHVSPAEEEVVFEKDAGAIWPDLIEKSGGHWVRAGTPERRPKKDGESRVAVAAR